MKKKIIRDKAYYYIAWSPYYKYDKYTALKLLPELAGMICLYAPFKDKYSELIFYNCWRDGLRTGLKRFLDPDMSLYPDIARRIRSETETDGLYYRYTVIDNDLRDLQDVMWWLIREYEPPYNDGSQFEASGRYSEVHVKEIQMGDDEIVERIPGII